MPDTDINVPTKIRVTHGENPASLGGGDIIPIEERTDMYPMGIYEAFNKDALERFTDYITGSHSRRYYQQLLDGLGDQSGFSWEDELQPAFKSCRILQERLSFFISPVTDYFLAESLNPEDFAFTFPHYHIPDGVYDWSVHRGGVVNGYWDGHTTPIDENGTHRSDYYLTLDSTYKSPKWVFRWLIHPSMWINNHLYEPCDEMVWHEGMDNWVYPFPGTPREPTYLRVKYALKAARPRWIQIPQTSSINDSFHDPSSPMFGSDWGPEPHQYKPFCHNSSLADITDSEMGRHKNFIVTNARWDYPVTIPKLDPYDMCAVKKLVGMPYYPAVGGTDTPYYRIRTQNSWYRDIPGLEPYVGLFQEELPRTTRLKIEVLEYVPHPLCILAEAYERCDLLQTLWEGLT